MSTRLAGILVVAAIAVSGCSEQGTEAQVELDASGSSTETATAAPSPSPSPTEATTSPSAPEPTAELPAVTVGEVPRGGARGAAAGAYVAYLETRMKAFHTVRFDPAEVSAVAIGDAYDGIQSGVAYRAREKLHMVGDVGVDVTRVDLAGRSATVTACLQNSTAEANRRGKVVELDAPPYYLATADLQRHGSGLWQVTSADFTAVVGC